MRKAFHISLLATALLVLSWWNMSSLTFFNSDTGMRFWQARELISNHRQSFAIDYPARFLDPESQFAPFYCAYLMLDGEYYFSITQFVPWVVSYLYQWLGTVGLAIIPAFSGVMIALGCYKLAKMAGISRPFLVFWSSILATPLLFYSLQLWDHSPAVACAVWAVYAAAKGISSRRWQPIARAGIIAAFSLGLRPEMYMFAVTLAAGLLIVAWRQWRHLLAFPVGGVLAALPLFWLQYQWVGHPLGLVVAAQLFRYGQTARPFVCRLPGTPMIVSRFLLFISDIPTFVASLLLIGSVFLLIFSLRLPRWRKTQLLLASLVMAAIAYAIWARRLWTYALPGLATTFPFLGFSFAYVDGSRGQNEGHPAYRLALLTAFFYIMAMTLFWPAYGGDHLAGRYLLPAYPLLIVLAFYAYENYLKEPSLHHSLKVVGVGLLVIGILLQLVSLRLLFAKRSADISIQAAIRDLPAEVVMTNHPFLPTIMTSLDDKLFLYVNSGEDFDILVPRLLENDLARFAFISLLDAPLAVPEKVGDVVVTQVAPVVYELEQR